jgi:NitT/TauT family transport system permease protein
MNKQVLKSPIFLFCISLFLFLVLWDVLGRSGVVSTWLISSPAEVASNGFAMVRSGFLWPHLTASAVALLLGFLSAVAAGSLFGFAISANETADKIFAPYIFMLNSLPFVALTPLLIIWFGVGLASKVAIIFLMCFAPIVIGVREGVKNADQKLLTMTQSFGAKKPFVFRNVIFFESLPFIFTAMRTAAGRGVVGLVIAEAFGYSLGIGYLISYFGATFATGNLIFAIVVLLALTLSLLGIISLIERKAIYWK